MRGIVRLRNYHAGLQALENYKIQTYIICLKTSVKLSGESMFTYSFTFLWITVCLVATIVRRFFFRHAPSLVLVARHSEREVCLADMHRDTSYCCGIIHKTQWSLSKDKSSLESGNTRRFLSSEYLWSQSQASCLSGPQRLAKLTINSTSRLISWALISNYVTSVNYIPKSSAG